MPTPNPDRSSPSRPKWPVVAALLAVLAPLVGCAQSGRPLLVRLFGPPTVTLKESYAARPDGPKVDHSAFTELLGRYVDEDGLVDYPGLGVESAALDDYLATLAAAPFDAMGRDEKLALLINGYNAATLRLILDHPDTDSIRSIKSAKRWKDERWNVGGKVYSLFQLENEAIRPHFKEVRIHWALVCAAVSCPPLRNEAYVADRLNDQLAEQEAIVLTRGTRWYQWSSDEKKILVTPIMQWYGGDFDQTVGGVLPYVAAHDAAVKKRIENGNPQKVGFLGYDWKLNSQANRSLLGAVDAKDGAQLTPELAAGKPGSP